MQVVNQLSNAQVVHKPVHYSYEYYYTAQTGIHVIHHDMEVSFLIISLCTYYNRGEVDWKQSR